MNPTTLPPPASPAMLVDGLREVALQVGALVEDGAVGVEELPGPDLGDLVEQLASVEAQLSYRRLRVVAAAEERQVATESAAASTAAWLSQRTRQTRSDAMASVGFAMVVESYAATRDALRSGRIDEPRARIVVNATDRLPSELTDAERADCEAALVEKAQTMDPGSLRRAARRMIERVERDTRRVDEVEGAQLEEDERHAEAITWFGLHDNGDGTWSGKFQIPELQGQMLKKLLDALTAPRRLGRTGEVDPTAQRWPGLSLSEARGQALLELIEHLPSDGLPSGVSATVVVHLDHENLLADVGVASLDTGGRISAAEARRLACGAEIIPLVLGGRSVPLDLGRRRRLFTESQRIALSARWDSCAAAGCDRPFAWCEIHHLIPWARGGPTDLANGLPLCGHHHRRAHDRNYRHRLRDDGRLIFEPVRPAHIPWPPKGPAAA